MIANAARPSAQVDRPGDLLGVAEGVVDHAQKFELVVGHAPRHQTPAFLVNHDDMVMSLARVDPCPRLFDLVHALPFVRLMVVAVDVLAVRSLHSDRCRRS